MVPLFIFQRLFHFAYAVMCADVAFLFRGSVCWLVGDPLPCLPTPSEIDGRARRSGCASYLQVPTRLPVATCCIGNIHVHQWHVH